MLFFLFISYVSVHAESSYVSTAKPTDCILPSQIKNGHYKVLEPEVPNLEPGTKLTNFTLELACNPGFHLTDNVIYWCENGEILGPFKEMSECLPYCRKVKKDVLSCGVGDEDQESRCLIPDAYVVDDLRNAPTNEEPLDCGDVGNQIAQIISGGRIIENKELPWHAGIYIKKKSPYLQICGGSLVTPTVVISAAHCFWTDVGKLQTASNYAVAVGKKFRPWNNKHDENVQKSDVVEIKIPPRFRGSATNLQDDIALVKVATPFIFTDSVKPVCLDFDFKSDGKHLSPGQLGKVAGWGLTSDNGRESPVLKVVEMPVVDINECIDKSDPSFRVHITSDKFCAGYQNGTSVCKGDSGGGLSFPETIRGVTRYFLRGVVSAAPRNENLCNTFSWASFTHVQKHESFIRETVPAGSSPAVTESISAFLVPENI